jgi:hypothetical protein
MPMETSPDAITAIHTVKYGDYHPEFNAVILAVHRRYIPVNIRVAQWSSFTDSMPVLVVLVGGSIGDYAAYMAGTESIEYCRDYGDKIRFEEAEIYFPRLQLQKDRYRE